MNDGISLIRYIFQKFITLIFDNFTIANNVSIGWVLVVIVIFGIMIQNIISAARQSPHLSDEKSWAEDGKTNWRSRW